VRNFVPDIFDEVNEDLRAERAQQLLRRYGGLLVALLVLAIAGVGGWQAWRWYASRESAKVAEVYFAAQRSAAEHTDNHADALAGFARVAQTGDAGMRALARLREASLKADSGDLPGALELWDRVAGDGSADMLLRDLASLFWALHQIDSGDPAVVASRLKQLDQADNPYHPLAEEGLALLALRQGHADAARDILKRLSQDPTAPDGVRGRANGLLTRLGAGPA
jgi:hypothetical protein